MWPAPAADGWIVLAVGPGARSAKPGTLSMTSITRWNRSRLLSMTISNGVVVVPSSRKPRTWKFWWLVLL